MSSRIDLWSDRRCRPTPQQALAELRADIVRVSCIEGDFLLSDGTSSRFYFDKYLFETRPAVLRRLAGFLSPLIPSGADRLAAQAPGALALGVAVSLEIGLPLVILRPDGNDPGGQARAEGELYDRETLVLVEDVVVTGTRALAGIDAIEAYGARVDHVLAVVDRGHGADVRLAARGVRYDHLFTAEELGLTERPAEVRER